MNWKELMAKAETMLEEITTLQAAAAKETDEERRKTADADVAAKMAEYDALQPQIATAVAAKERQDRLLAAKRALTAVPAGDVGEQTVPAQPTDHAAKERALVEGTYDYIAGKTLSGQMQEALKPTSDKFVSGKDGVALPKSVVQGIFGKVLANRLWGKENPLTSAGTGQGEANLVPQEYIAELLQLPPEPTSLLQLATVVPCKTGVLLYPTLVQTDAQEYGGVVISWIEEAAAKPETMPTFSQLTITAHELAAHTQISHRLLARSAISLETLLASLFRDAVFHAVDTSFLVGTGVGQPLGIVNDAAVRTVARTVVNQVEWLDLVNLQTALLYHHRAGARFVLDGTVEQNLMQQHLAAYAAAPARTSPPMFFPSVAGGMYDRLFGSKYLTTYRARNLGQSGDVIFGDWSKYLVAMEQDIVIKRSDEYKFLNNEAVFVVYMVIGGRAGHPRAFAYLDRATS